jgi:hypothetical protein
MEIENPALPVAKSEMMSNRTTTSRERIPAALQHRQPDRVPIDLSGYRSSGIACGSPKSNL